MFAQLEEIFENFMKEGGGGGGVGGGGQTKHI